MEIEDFIVLSIVISLIALALLYKFLSLKEFISSLVIAFLIWGILVSGYLLLIKGDTTKEYKVNSDAKVDLK